MGKLFFYNENTKSEIKNNSIFELNEITAITLRPTAVRQFSMYSDQTWCEVSLCIHVIVRQLADFLTKCVDLWNPLDDLFYCQRNKRQIWGLFLMLDTGLTVQIILYCSQQTAVAARSNILYISNILWRAMVLYMLIISQLSPVV